jgi:preprotein translocase subunit YajC
MLNFLLATAETAPQPSGWEMYGSLIMMAVVFVAFYFILIRPQKKKEKEAAKMRDNLEIGDEIITIGGIIGRVVSLKEDHIVIETGSDRSKIRIKRWAIQSNETQHDD